jgi:hypothetical protein
MKVFLGIAALVASIALAYWLILGREETTGVVVLAPASAPATEPPTLASHTLVLQEASGRIVRKRAGESEVPLNVGDAVSLEDEVSVGSDAEAVLGRAGVRLAFGPDTELAFHGYQDDALQLFIGRGSVLASAQGTGLDVLSAATPGRVRVRDAAARIYSDGTQGVVVAANEGRVWVENAGQRLALAPGEATRLRGTNAPDKLWKIPASILLKVAWPQASELNVRKLRVSGKTTPHALVRAKTLNGARALANDRGEFVLDLALQEGKNTVTLQSEEPGGKRQQTQTTVTVDTTPAGVGVETSPDMWKKR